MASENRVVFLSGKIVNLRPVSKLDIPAITRWINDPEVREFLAATFPQTEKREEEWVEKIGKDDKDIVLCIETKEGEPIGLMGIHRIDWLNRTATTGAIIGEKEYWGRNYGTDAKMHLLQYAFEVLGLHRVKSDVLAYNKRSLRYSLRCGYKIEGRLRKEKWKLGDWHDLIILGIFREEWERVWKRYKKTGRVR